MKYIKLLTLVLVSSLFFSGCYLNQAYYKFNPEEKNIYMNTALPKWEKRESAAYIIKQAALLFKERGIKYFNISPKYILKYGNGIDFTLTDMKSTLDYCFPEEAGLEDKCVFWKMNFLPAEPNLRTPTWSVEQVLSDPIVEKYAKNVQDVDFRPAKGKEIYR